MEIMSCPFCEEQKNQKFESINKSRFIAETENFIVFPTTGGFIDNYQLIVPKKHVNCLGELSIEEIEELNELILWQKEINKNYFNSNSSMFEHGALHPNNESGKSIVHAHLHIFPNNNSLIKEIEKYKFNIKEIDNIHNLKEICKTFDNYLYYSDIDDINYIITHEGIPSQFLRMIFAKTQGIDKWNWREYPFTESIEKNINFYKDNTLFYRKKKDGVNNDNITK